MFTNELPEAGRSKTCKHNESLSMKLFRVAYMIKSDLKNIAS